MELVLRPGDLLYLPRGWWHSVAASEGERSLHLTFGLQTTTGAQLVSWLADDLRRHEVLREDLPVHASSGEQAAFLDRLRKHVTVALEDPDVISRYIAARDGDDLTRLRPSLPHVMEIPADPELRVRLTTARAGLIFTDEGVTFRACGNEWKMAAEAAPLLSALLTLSSETVSLGDLAVNTRLGLEDVAAVATELVAGQALTVEGGAR